MFLYSKDVVEQFFGVKVDDFFRAGDELKIAELCTLDDITGTVGTWLNQGRYEVRLGHYDGGLISSLAEIHRMPIIYCPWAKPAVAVNRIEIVNADGSPMRDAGSLVTFVRYRMVHLALRKHLGVIPGSIEDKTLQRDVMHSKALSDRKSHDFVQLNITANRITGTLADGIAFSAFKHHPYPNRAGLQIISSIKGNEKTGVITLNGPATDWMVNFVDPVPFVQSVESRIRELIRKFTESDEDYGFAMRLQDDRS